MLVSTVRIIKSILEVRRPGTKCFKPPTPWTARIPSLRPLPLTFEEKVEEDMEGLGLTGAMRNVLLRAAREAGPRDFDLMVAITKYASDRFSYLLALPRLTKALPHHLAAKQNANDPSLENKPRERTLRTLDLLLTHQPLTVPSFRPAIGAGTPSWKRQSPAGPAADLMLSPSEREALMERTPLKPLEVDNCLMKLHKGSVAKFDKWRARKAAQSRKARKVVEEGRAARKAEEGRARKAEAERAPKSEENQVRKAEEVQAAQKDEKDRETQQAKEEPANQKPKGQGTATGARGHQGATPRPTTWAMIASKDSKETVVIGAEENSQSNRAKQKQAEERSNSQGGPRQSRREQGGGGYRWQPRWSRPRRKKVD